MTLIISQDVLSKTERIDRKVMRFAGSAHPTDVREKHGHSFHDIHVHTLRLQGIGTRRNKALKTGLLQIGT
jgi:hypothetical protein